MKNSKLFLSVFIFVIVLVGANFFIKNVFASGVTAAEIQSITTTVTSGSTGQPALLWQRFLNTYNNSNLIEDGNFGPLSVAQAKLWQASRNSLFVDGMLGNKSRIAAVEQIDGGAGGVAGGRGLPSTSNVKLDLKTLNLLSAGAGGGNILRMNEAGLTTDQSANNSAGPRLFTLSNPLSPLLNASKNWDTNATNDAQGDFGSSWRVGDVAWSSDGTYSAAHGAGSQKQIYFYHNGDYRWVPTAGAGFFAGIVQSGGNTFLVTNDRVVNMTDIDTQPINPQLVSKGTSPKPMPANTPNISYTGIFDRSVILGDMFVKVSFGDLGGKFGGTGTPNLKLYSFNQSSPVIDYPLPASIASVYGGAAIGFVAPDGSKYVIIGAGAKLFMYQVSGTTFLPIVENVTLPGVSINGSEIGTSVVGVVTKGNPAIMTFNSASSVSPKIFLISDLKNNKINNIASAVNYALGRVMAAAAYVQGDNTYVYTSSATGGQAQNVSVWNLAGTGSGDTIPPDDLPGSSNLTGQNATCAVSVGGSIVYYTSSSGSCNQ
jgi:hypothetical protein